MNCLIKFHIPISKPVTLTCIFILTRADGTLFDASSIQEEDVVEICIQFGHTHPKGVLQYSTIESVILFHTVDELQVMVCGVMKASTLHEEAIRVRTSPPSATHVRAYMAAVNGEPSGTKPPSEGEEEPHSSPSNCTQVGGPTTTASKPQGSCRWWVVTAYGGSLLGGCFLRAECTPRDPHKHLG